MFISSNIKGKTNNLFSDKQISAPSAFSLLSVLLAWGEERGTCELASVSPQTMSILWAPWTVACKYSVTGFSNRLCGGMHFLLRSLPSPVIKLRSLRIERRVFAMESPRSQGQLSEV